MHQDTQVPLYSAEYVCTQHRIAVVVGVGRLRKQRGVVGVGRLRPGFYAYVLCYAG